MCGTSGPLLCIYHIWNLYFRKPGARQCQEWNSTMGRCASKRSKNPCSLEQAKKQKSNKDYILNCNAVFQNNSKTATCLQQQPKREIFIVPSLLRLVAGNGMELLRGGGMELLRSTNFSHERKRTAITQLRWSGCSWDERTDLDEAEWFCGRLLPKPSLAGVLKRHLFWKKNW